MPLRPSHEQLKTRDGTTLSRTIAEYDSSRHELPRRRLSAACHAPFLSMDFGPTGAISLCNHSHKAIAYASDGVSVLDVWRGATYARYRHEMRQYVLDEDNCRHCVRQCEAGSSGHVFGVEQFDRWAHDDPEPLYPRRLIFRLNSTCNLACVMCDGLTSSRIRRERDRLPLAPSAYGERFFADMETILPHVEHVEFYGGEPFLVKEHARIFEIMDRIGARCSIYVNTNGVSLNARARQLLETLNFRTIAISMDAVSAEVHESIRYGLRSEVFHRNLEYFLDLRKRRGVDVMLNVTEHRKNWFELPEVFRFAETRRLHLHINTCIHPHNVTLYTLLEEQLTYVLRFLEGQRTELLRDFPHFANLASYDFLLSLIRGELATRCPDWQPATDICNAASDGLLAAPVAGSRPFESPAKVLAEVDRVMATLSGTTATRVLGEMLARVQKLESEHEWTSAGRHIEGILGRRGSMSTVTPAADTYPTTPAGDPVEGEASPRPGTDGVRPAAGSANSPDPRHPDDSTTVGFQFPS